VGHHDEGVGGCVAGCAGWEATCGVSFAAFVIICIVIVPIGGKRIVT